MKKNLLFFLLTLIFSISVKGQFWQWAAISGSGGAQGLDIAFNNRGGFYVLSNTDNTLVGPYTAQCAGIPDLLVCYTNAGLITWQTGISAANCEAISTDKLGNVYVIGSCANATFCSVNNTSSVITQQGNGDAFLAKYDFQGNLQWVKTWGNSITDEKALTIKTDVSGNSWVSGTEYYNTNNTNTTKVFLTKFDMNGNVLWTQNYFSTAGPSSIDVDTFGNSYLAGIFMDTLTLGNHTIVSSQVLSIFIAKYDINGNLLWLKRVGNNSCQVEKIKCDTHGFLYFTGKFIAPCSIGGTTFSGQNAMYLAKYDTSGVAIWVKSTATKIGTALEVDTTGNCYVTGVFSNNSSFNTINGPILLSTQKQRDIFVAKFNSNGGIVWAIAPSGSAGIQNWPSGIICNTKNEIFLTGAFTQTTNFGNATLFAPTNSSFGSDVFVTMIKDSIATIVTKLLDTDVSLHIIVYPNPCEDKITIDLNKNNITVKEIGITINDVLGKELLHFIRVQPTSEEISINIQSFPAGIYFMKFYCHEQTSVIKIIKQ